MARELLTCLRSLGDVTGKVSRVCENCYLIAKRTNQTNNVASSLFLVSSHLSKFPSSWLASSHCGQSPNLCLFSYLSFTLDIQGLKELGRNTVVASLGEMTGAHKVSLKC
jgi:hypothetical protein